MDGTGTTAGNYLIYDGECPFCSRFVRMQRLRETVGPIRLIDARSDAPEVADARARGFRIDDGMVLRLDGAFHHGDDCLNRLALLSSRSGAFNRVNHWMFRSPRIARVAYPLLRSGRALTLRLMGREGLGY